MRGLDTNVLVRYMVQDDPRQSRIASRFIESGCSAEVPAFIGHIVLCELVWVLTGAYEYPKGRVVQALEQILRIAQLRVEEPQLVWQALVDYRSEEADFSDHLLARSNLKRGCEHTVTFDKSAARALGFTLLT